MNLRARIDSPVAVDRRGFVVPAVIFALTIMALIAMVALRTVDDEKRSSRAVRESAGAFYVADGGLQKTLGNWPSTSVKTLNPGDSLNLGWQTQTNGSSYRTVIHRVDNGGSQVYAVVVYGRGAGPLGGWATVVNTVVGTGGIFKWGVFSQGLLTMGGSGAMSDSYNSLTGPYNAATAGKNGDLATNNNVSLGGGAIVHGDASAVGTVGICSGCVVDGTVTNGAPTFPTQPILTCPTGGYTPAANVPLTTGVTYDPTSGALTVGGGHNLTLTAPPTQYHFSSVVLSGGSTLTINSGGQHVDIWIDDGFTSGGGGVVNTSQTPTSLALWACGSPTKPTKWNIGGGSGAYFTACARTTTSSWAAAANQPRPGAGGAGRHVQGGPILPHHRGRNHPAAAARDQGRSPALRQSLS